MGGTIFGGWIAGLATDGLGYIIIGALAGWWGSVRLWNRWVRVAASTANVPGGTVR
jgi:hypothetical protein